MSLVFFWSFLPSDFSVLSLVLNRLARAPFRFSFVSLAQYTYITLIEFDNHNNTHST